MRCYRGTTLAAGILLCILPACNLQREATSPNQPCFEGFDAVATRIEYPNVEPCNAPEALMATAPHTLDNELPPEFRDLTLKDAVTTALTNSQVMKDLGGRALFSPESLSTVFDPAIRESDPLFGIEGALSAFDAQWNTRTFWTKNDRVLNNVTLGGGTRELQQDLANYQTEISKTTATGTRFALNNLTRYDANNAPGNLFFSAWDTQFEANVRQPLLQGSGIAFNRIAGPAAQPGLNFSQGVLIARINTDISIADLETGLRNFLSDVEDAYWELYFAYRDLDAKQLARDASLETWRSVEAKFVQDVRGGEADKESQAREQYFRFQDLVHDALNGTPTALGVYKAERRLRLLMGLPTSDGQLLRPADEPALAKVVFSWDQSLAEALTRRIELRRQSWVIKRRELELIAARNFTLPRLDAVALYRFRGFGDDLTGDGPMRFESAFKDLGTGDHQEWEMGLQLNMPIGFRQAWAGVRKAELELARARAILREQEQQVSHGLADAIAETSRSNNAIRVAFNRLHAAQQNREATEAAYLADQVPLDQLLDAQQRLADARSRYFRSLSDYAKALKNVHAQKGSLLEYNRVQLSEGPWPSHAYQDGYESASRWRQKHIDYRLMIPDAISQGEVPQWWSAAEPEVLPASAADRAPEFLPPVDTGEEVSVLN